MSAEVENGKEEDSKEPQPPFPPPKTEVWKRALEYWQVWIKLLEIFVCCACLGLCFETIQITGLGSTDLHHVGLMYTTFTGYTVINVVLLAGYVVNEALGFKTSAIFSMVGAILCLATSTVLIADRSYFTKREIFHPQMYLLERLTWAVAFSMGNGAVFATDSVLTFIWRKDFRRQAVESEV